MPRAGPWTEEWLQFKAAEGNKPTKSYENQWITLPTSPRRPPPLQEGFSTAHAGGKFSLSAEIMVYYIFKVLTGYAKYNREINVHLPTD